MPKSGWKWTLNAIWAFTELYEENYLTRKYNQIGFLSYGNALQLVKVVKVVKVEDAAALKEVNMYEYNKKFQNPIFFPFNPWLLEQIQGLQQDCWNERRQSGVITESLPLKMIGLIEQNSS